MTLLKNVSIIDFDVQRKIYWEAMFQDDIDVCINDRTVKMDIKPTIWQDIATDNNQNKNFARY